MQPVLAVCVEWLERNNARLASPAKNVPMESQEISVLYLKTINFHSHFARLRES
jgi:hypothetical protein